MGQSQGRPRSHNSDEMYMLLRKWIPEYIDIYMEMDDKYQCSYTGFLGGLIEYMRSVKHYVFPEGLCINTLIWMTDDVLRAIYPKSILKKGTLKGLGPSEDVYAYLSGCRLKTLP